MAKGGGGAWKVAYADFVTAMMALFMVLWISSQDEEILVATSRYFQQPFNSPLTASSGILNMDSNKPSEQSKAKSDEKGEGSSTATETNSIDLQFLNSMMKDFYRLLHVDETLEDRPIDVQVTSDGLRITLFDYARKPLFQENTAEFTEWGTFVLQSLSWMIERHRFQVVIEGHTKAGLNLPDPAYTGWELSSDRANAARRLLTHYAVDPKRIDRVTGYADQYPVPKLKPDAEGNQRIAISLTVGNRNARGNSNNGGASSLTKKP